MTIHCWASLKAGMFQPDTGSDSTGTETDSDSNTASHCRPMHQRDSQEAFCRNYRQHCACDVSDSRLDTVEQHVTVLKTYRARAVPVSEAHLRSGVDAPTQRSAKQRF